MRRRGEAEVGGASAVTLDPSPLAATTGAPASDLTDGDARGRGPSSEPLRDPRDLRMVVVLGALSILAHVIASLAGLRVSAADLSTQALTGIWHLLPVPLLQHAFIQSIVHLDSQPPALNVVTGVLLHLPEPLRAPLVDVVMIGLAAVVPIAAFALMRELRIARTPAFVVTLVLVVADPAQLLYPSMYFYTLPTAAIVSATAWAAVRWVRTRRLGPGLAYCGLAGLLVLTNSTYQLELVLLASIPLVYVLRHEWRQVLTAAAVPLLVVLLVYVNDAAQFGSFATSSWIGMNLARVTTMIDSPKDVAQLVNEGVLSKTALVRPFSCLDQYGRLGAAARTGDPALDEPSKVSCVTVHGARVGNANYNNLAYVAISRRYLSDDLKWIEHRPVAYLHHVAGGLGIWMIPAEQQYLNSHPSWGLSGYTSLYDHVVLLQAQADPLAGPDAIRRQKDPSPENLSATECALTFAGVVLLPLAILVRRRRRTAAQVATALWIWIVTGYVLVSTTMIEIGEDSRFRFEGGALPIVAAAVAIAWLVDRGDAEMRPVDELSASTAV